MSYIRLLLTSRNSALSLVTALFSIKGKFSNEALRLVVACGSLVALSMSSASDEDSSGGVTMSPKRNRSKVQKKGSHGGAREASGAR